MTATCDNQILQAACNSPIALRIHLSLIPSVKPPVLNHFGGGGGPIPIAWKDVGPTNKDLITVSQLHLDARDGWTNTARRNMVYRIHCANGGCFGQPINLKNRNAEHLKK